MLASSVYLLSISMCTWGSVNATRRVGVNDDHLTQTRGSTVLFFLIFWDGAEVTE